MGGLFVVIHGGSFLRHAVEMTSQCEYFDLCTMYSQQWEGPNLTLLSHLLPALGIPSNVPSRYHPDPQFLNLSHLKGTLAS